MAKEIDTFDTTGLDPRVIKEILTQRRAKGWKVKTAAGRVLILKRKAK